MSSGIDPTARVFPATLGRFERLVTIGVGIGVGIGVPAVLGVSFAVSMDRLEPLVLPIGMGLILGITALLRPTGYAVTRDSILVLRPLRPRRFSLTALRAIEVNASIPRGSLGVLRSGGFFGTYGLFWNRGWGRFEVWVTRGHDLVLLVFAENRRLVVSPDDPTGFADEAVRVAHGIGVAVSTSPEQDTAS